MKTVAQRLSLVFLLLVLTLLAVGCVGFGVKDYEGFRSALESGASCEQLLDIRAGFEGRDDVQKRIDEDLEEIDCKDKRSERRDR